MASDNLSEVFAPTVKSKNKARLSGNRWKKDLNSTMWITLLKDAATDTWFFVVWCGSLVEVTVQNFTLLFQLKKLFHILQQIATIK